jgi:hypothetical protein
MGQGADRDEAGRRRSRDASPTGNPAMSGPAAAAKRSRNRRANDATQPCRSRFPLPDRRCASAGSTRRRSRPEGRRWSSPHQPIRQSKQLRSWPASQSCRRGCRATVADVPVIQHCVGMARAHLVKSRLPMGPSAGEPRGPGPATRPTLTSCSAQDRPDVLSHNLKTDPIKAQNPSHAVGSDARPNRGRPVGVRRWTWPQHTMPLETQMPWRETIRLILLAVLIAALGTAAIKILVEQLS